MPHIEDERLNAYLRIEDAARDVIKEALKPYHKHDKKIMMKYDYALRDAVEALDKLKENESEK